MPLAGESVFRRKSLTGQAVAVLAFKSAPLWRRPAGLDVFSPRYFGYDLDYIPVEQRLHASNGHS
ncbi:MAG: DUF917 domain-containing protein [Gammaproteobacteria bacterium]|nr:DUF917 domain-containing protein [Gammaproteobacteria bacterium]